MPVAWDEFSAVDESQTETDWTQFEAAPEKQTIQQATAPLTPEQQLAITPDQDRFQLVTGRAPEPGQSYAELAGGPVIPIPELHGKTLPGKIGAAIFNVGKQIPEALETPATWALGPFGVTPVGHAILGGVFGGLAAKRAGEQAGEASVTGDPQTAIESGLNFGLGAFMAKPGFSKVELPPSLQGPPAPGALLRLPEGGTPPRIEPLPPEPLAPAAAPVPAPKPPATTPAAAAEPVPATAGERFKTASEADLNRGNNFSTEIGMQVESLDDLKALAKERADALARQSALIKELGQFKDRNSPEYAAKWKEVSLAGLKSQLAGEAIQVATNSGGWVEGSTDANFGERPLDWSKNPEVADWLSKNSEALNIKLPEIKPAPEPAPAPAAAPAPEPAAVPVPPSVAAPVAKADAEAAATAKPPAGPISAGPGAASPGDVAPEPPVAEPVMSRPPEQRPNGIVTPSSPGLVSMLGALPGKVMTYLRGAAGDTMPKTTASNRATGEAGAEYLSSHIYAPRGARVFSTEVLRGTDIDPARFGAALAEDNLRSIREGFRAEATAARARGNADAADAATAKADAVTTVVGHKNSPFATEDEYQDFLADPVTKEAVERHKQQWEEVVDPMFKKAQSIDPNEELAPRGQQTGARVNLKAILPGETGTRVVRSGPSLTATFKRKSPFARKAKGTGTAYEVDYHELMSNTFTRQTEIANKNAFDKALVAAGDAVIGRPGQQVEIKGERGVPFPLTRRLLIGQGEPIPLAQNIYVRQSLAREYRTASNVDPGYRIPVVTPVMNLFNRAALAGLTDFTIHASNQMTALFNRPISGRLLSDTLLSTFGRADVPVTLTRALIKSFQDNEAQLTELANIGALRETHKGGNPLGKILAKTDQVTRLLLDDTYQRLVKAGIAEDTATARREYVNQIGQYNKRAQGMFIRILRDTGFGPFATAGRTFNAMGIKMATLSPGVKATNNFAAAALRLNVLSKWVGFATLLGTLNYLLTKNKGGGLMGRPGVPIGNLDTGKTDKNGKPLSIPLSDIMGLGRAARVTGIKGAVNAKRLGLTDTDALDTAARDIINATLGPAMGPAPRAGFVSATGRPPAVNVPRTAPVAPPGTSQFKVNVEEALKDANPVVKSFADWHAGKTAGEAFGQQLPRFTMQAGKTEAVTAKYPKIVNKAQLNEYAEYLAGEARKIPLRERYRWVQDRLRADEVTGANVNETRVLLNRRGVFHYQ